MPMYSRYPTNVAQPSAATTKSDSGPTIEDVVSVLKTGADVYQATQTPATVPGQTPPSDFVGPPAPPYALQQTSMFTPTTIAMIAGGVGLLAVLGYYAMRKK